MDREMEQEWPAGPHRQALCALDELARCPICHEAYATPLSLACGHSFCSSCIRSSIEFQERQGGARCPQCRAGCDTRELRANHALKDLAEGYLAARYALLASAQQAQQEQQQQKQREGRRMSGRLQKRRRCEDDLAARAGTDTAAGPQAVHTRDGTSTKSATTFIDLDKQDDDDRRQRRTRSATAQRAAPAAAATKEEGGSESAAVTLSSESSWGSGPPSQNPAQRGNGGARTAAAEPPPPKSKPKLLRGYVECPKCTMQLREALLNDHLDRCLEGPSDSEDLQQARGAPRQQAPEAAAAGKARSRLTVPPKLVFAMLTARDLQAKLRAFGLPTEGKRQELEQRYNRFRVEVQVALDAGEAATYSGLARRLMRKEKQQAAAAAFGAPKGAAAGAGGGGGGKAGGAPSAPAAASFEALISKARARAGRLQQGTPAEPQPAAQPQPTATPSIAAAGLPACQPPHSRGATGAGPSGCPAAEQASMPAAASLEAGVQQEPGTAGALPACMHADAGRAAKALNGRAQTGQPPAVQQEAGGNRDWSDDVSMGQGDDHAENTVGGNLDIRHDDYGDHISDSEPDIDVL